MKARDMHTLHRPAPSAHLPFFFFVSKQPCGTNPCKRVGGRCDGHREEGQGAARERQISWLSIESWAQGESERECRWEVQITCREARCEGQSKNVGVC